MDDQPCCDITSVPPFPGTSASSWSPDLTRPPAEPTDSQDHKLASNQEHNLRTSPVSLHQEIKNEEEQRSAGGGEAAGGLQSCPMCLLPFPAG